MAKSYFTESLHPDQPFPINKLESINDLLCGLEIGDALDAWQQLKMLTMQAWMLGAGMCVATYWVPKRQLICNLHIPMFNHPQYGQTDRI